MDTLTPQTDHDLLIVLHTEMKGMRKDIQDLNDGLSGKVADHETRIREMERLTENLNLKMIFGTAVVSFAMTLVTALLLGYIKKQLGI